jgi:hypothetical protein
MREILFRGCVKEMAHIILEIIDLGKDSGAVICKMDMAFIKIREAKPKKVYGEWDKE